MSRSFATTFAIGACLSALACSSGPRARDIAGERRPRAADLDASADGGRAVSGSGDVVPEAPPVIAQPVIVGKRPRVLTRASSRALAVDATNVYYGDADDDAVYAMPKAGGAAIRLARHAPVAGAFALEADTLTWIASPGDAVLRVPIRTSGDGGVPQPTTLRDHGIFSDVAALPNGDVFITEAIGAGGALIRVGGSGAPRIVPFEGSPRVVLADAAHAYVTTPSKIYRAPHVKGELETIATGFAFGSAELDDEFLYVVTEIDKARVVARLPKAGGPMQIVARDVRDAPIDVAGGEVFFFDAMKPQLRAAPVAGGAGRTVSQDEAFSTPTAIEVDAKTIYVAAGSRDSPAILAVDRR
jgi:hypothetical protein